MNCYVITTKNNVGQNRQRRFTEAHSKNLKFQFVISENTEVHIDHFDSQLNSYLTGTLGCMNTHLKAWKKFLAEGMPWALILEDDAMFMKIDEVSELYRTISELTPNRPIICQVGFNQSKLNARRILLALVSFARNPLLIRQNRLVKGYTWGTHAYLLNRSAALALTQLIDTNLDSPRSDSFSRFVFPLDLFLISYSERYMGSGFTFLRSVKNLITQEFIDSSINPRLYTHHMDRGLYRNQFQRRIKEIIEIYVDGRGSKLDLLKMQASVE